MRRVLRWVAWSVAASFLLGLLLAGAVYVGSERILRRRYAVGLPAVTLPTDSTALLEGERLARVRGCFGGCHGERFEGQVFFDEPGVARLVAPNLTQAAARWSDPELVRIIRYGVRPNGRSVFSMPAHTFSALSEEDLGAILAFLRHTPPEPGLQAELQPRWLGRLGLVLGKYRPEAELIPQDTLRPPSGTPAGPSAPRSVSCTDHLHRVPRDRPARSLGWFDSRPAYRGRLFASDLHPLAARGCPA